MSNEGCVRGRHAVLRRGARARRPAIGGAGDYACASAAALGVNLKAGQFRRPDDQFRSANTATQHNFPPMMSSRLVKTGHSRVRLGGAGFETPDHR